MIPTRKAHCVIFFTVQALHQNRPVFPRGADPVGTILKKKIPVRIEQHPESRLTRERLNLGLKNMYTQDREAWLSDIETGRFVIVLTPSDDHGQALSEDEADED